MKNHTIQEIGHWQRRMESTFSVRGDIGPSVLKLESAEKNHVARLITKSEGFTCAMDSFFHVAMEALKEATNQKHFSSLKVAVFIAIFRRLRSSYNIFWHGYYEEALSNLRGAYEAILYLGAAENNVLALDDLYNAQIDPNMSVEENLAAIHEHKKPFEKLINDFMYGKKSGFNPKVQSDLVRFLKTFHFHVHRCESSFFNLVVSLNSGKSVKLCRDVDMTEASTFTNTCVALTWCFLRLTSKLSSKGFSQKWVTRYHVMDESFAFYIEGFDKDFARAVEEFVNAKFDFKP